MRKIVLSAILFLSVIFLAAQNKQTELLRQQLKEHLQEDTARVNLLNRLSSADGVSPDDREKLAKEALALAEKIGYEVGQGYAILNLGGASNIKGNVQEGIRLINRGDSMAKKLGDVDLEITALLRKSGTRISQNATEALGYALQAEELAAKSGNKLLLSAALRTIGNTYQNSLSDYSRGMEYIMKSIPVSEEANCLTCLALSWTSLAGLYNVIGDQEKALLYYQKAFDANKELGNTNLAYNLLNNIGERYRLTGRYPEAIKAYKESLLGLKDPYRIGLTESNLADVYVRTDSLPDAFYYGFSALKIAKEIEDKEGETWIDGILSRAYLKNKMADSAIYYGNYGLNLAKETGTIEFMRDNAEALSNAYAFKNDFRNAYNYRNLFTAYRDSMINAEVSNKSTVLAYNYDLEKKQAEITSLSQQKKLQQNFLISVLAVLLIIIIGSIALMRNNRQKRLALAELKQTQTQLVQSEKMASLGELTAGIAHEIQNPLNFVNNFSDVNTELLKELSDEIEKGNISEVKNLAADLTENSRKINQHGKRADAIVKGMLQHSRTDAGHKELTDINAYADEYLRLAFHGMRAKDKSFNAAIQTDFDKTIGKINIVPQDIGRVLLNLYNNAFYAVNEKKKSSEGGFEPAVIVSTKKAGNKAEIKVKDNGYGIPQNKIDKIFQPFFTTKPAGAGTGLGLSLSYDIIKAHGGEIQAGNTENGGAVFTILLPL
jgi:signal transduction histidine kinase